MQLISFNAVAAAVVAAAVAVVAASAAVVTAVAAVAVVAEALKDLSERGRSWIRALLSKLKKNSVDIKFFVYQRGRISVTRC